MYPRAGTYRYPMEALDRARYVTEFLHILGVPLYAQNFYYEDIGLAEFQSMDWPTLYQVMGFLPQHCDVIAGAFYELHQYRFERRHTTKNSFKQRVSHAYDRAVDTLTLRRNKAPPGRMDPLEEETLLDEIQRMPPPITYPVSYSGTLFTAIMAANPEWVQELLLKNEFVNGKNRHGWTPLMLASYTGSEDIVKLLLNSGARVDIQNKKGENVFSIAANWGHAKILDLLSACVPVLERVMRLHPVHTVDKSSCSALHYATLYRQHECIRILLEVGADPNKPDEKGMTPMLIAASAGCGTSMRMMVRKGGDMRRKNKSGQDGYALWPYDPQRLEAELRIPRALHAST